MSVLDDKHFHDEAAAYRFVEAHVWPQGRICPHCGEVANSGKLKGKSTRLGVYKCYACRKPFTVKVGTIFEASHIKLHIWLQAMFLLCGSKKGISSNQLARTLNITLKSAWFLSHRIREAMRDDNAGPLGGRNKVIEADETYMGGKDKNKHASKRAHGQWRQDRPAVVSLVERGGQVRSTAVAEVGASTLRGILLKNADRRSYLMTDEHAPYKRIGQEFAGHASVEHTAGQYVKHGGFAHTNTAENFFSIMKRGVYGTYHHVSQQHLKRYLAEFDFRYSNRIGLGVDDNERTLRALRGIMGKRLTYV